MTPLEIVLASAASVGVAAANYVASKRGGREGSSGALNGTADAVRRIESIVVTNDAKLDGHIAKTAENFREISDRTSNIEGRLSVAVVAKKAPRKPTRQ
jgi:hypothetical protein